MELDCSINATSAHPQVVGNQKISKAALEIAIKPGKLNKTQLKEFAESGISEEYARLNFGNITRKYTEPLLGVTDDLGRRSYGTALLGGWADYSGSTFKPKQPRMSRGRIAKYESPKGSSPRLVEIRHPESVIVNGSIVYVIEGLKKAVAVAQATGCRVYAFNGLTQGIALIDEINALKTADNDVRIILDNDNSINAIDNARSLVRKLDPGIKIAQFKGFKGIDDALMAGIKIADLRWVESTKWIANYSGFLSGDAYTFSSPRFHEVHVPAGKSLVNVLGAKGTGKTYGVEQHCKTHPDITTFNTTHRRTLAIGNADRLNIPYIDSDKYSEGGSATLCLNKILKIKLEDCVGVNFVLDEVVQVVDYLMHSSTLKYIRPLVFSHLSQVLTRVRETGGIVFAMDADNDRKTLRFLMALGGFEQKDIFSITNTFVPDRGVAYFTPGMPTGHSTNGKQPKLYPTNILNNVLQQVLAGKKVWLCLSAQKALSKFGTKVLEQWFIDRGVSPNVMCRVDAETVGDPNHPAYRAASRLDEFTTEFMLYLVSPTLATGCDIQTYDFDFVYSLQGGAQRVDSARQAPERIRDVKPIRIVYAPEKILWKKESGLTSPSLLESFRTAHDNALKICDENWFAGLEDANRASIVQAVEEWFLIDARERWDEKNHYAEKLLQGMEADGYTIEPFESGITIEESGVIYDELSVISEAFVLGERLNRERVEQITDEQAKEYFKSEQLTQDEVAKLEAYQIRKKYGLEPTVIVQAALDEGKGERLENQFDALEGHELAQQIWQRDHYFSAGKEGLQELTTDFVKRSSRMVKIKALHDVNFFTRIRQEFSSEEAHQILTDLRANPLNITLFNLPTTDGSQAVKTVGAIARTFDFSVRAVRKTAYQRFYQALDIGFSLSDSLDLKPQVFNHFREKLERSVANWQNFKDDFHKVKRGQRLDSAAELPELSDEFKYAKLSTRARTLPLPEMPNYRWVNGETAEEFKAWLESQPEMAIDIETYGLGKKGGLSHLIGQIRLIQFSCLDAIWLLEKSDFDLVRNAIKDCLLNPEQRKIGHNFMFDLRFLRKEFGVIASNCADTMLGSRCLLGDLGAAKITSHSLKSACENFLGISMDKREQKSDWGTPSLSDSQCGYAAADTWNTFVLYKRLEELCKDPSKLLLPFPKMMAWEAWELENKFLFAAQLMEATGYEIDVPALNEAIAKYTSVRDSLLAKWDLPCTPTQKAQIKRYLSDKYKISLKSVNKASAANHTNIPEILLMQQICACNALLLQLAAIEKQVEVNNGRVTTVFKTLTGTGRTSTGATGIDKMLINLQSLAARVNPALKGFDLSKLKGVFKTNLIIDLPASHGRISAELSGDEQHLEGYLDSSIDMHCITAAAVAEAVFPEMGYTAEWIKANKDTDPIAKGLRDTAKNTYYGWLNGAGAARIQEQIKSNLQIDADFNACKKALEGLQTLFAKTTEYGKKKLKELETNQFIVNGVICGWLEVAGTYLCWKLGVVGGDFRIPATKAFACLWSRAESLLMKRSCIRIAEKFEATPEWGAKLQNFIHDEVNCEIGHPDAAAFAHAVVQEEFGKICPRTVGGFDPLQKCYPLQNWGQKG